MRVLTIVLVAIALWGAQTIGTASSKNPPKKDERVVFLEHAHELVAAKLLDPPTARFSNDSLVRDTDGKLQYVCGFVQGKNSFGGYAQPALYAVDPATGQVFVARNHLTEEDARDKAYADGIKFMRVACSEEAKPRMEEAPVLPAGG